MPLLDGSIAKNKTSMELKGFRPIGPCPPLLPTTVSDVILTESKPLPSYPVRAKSSVSARVSSFSPVLKPKSKTSETDA